jgi:hypothetical protein
MMPGAPALRTDGQDTHGLSVHRVQQFGAGKIADAYDQGSTHHGLDPSPFFVGLSAHRGADTEKSAVAPAVFRIVSG